jgi:hypothetical protein
MADPIRIKIPTFHAGQHKIWNRRGRRNAVRCGRRFGKTKMIVSLACSAAAKGRSVGVFTPEISQYNEIWSEIVGCLDKIIKTKNKNDKQIKTTTGGKIDFWHINDNELAGRGREYDLILIDEAAFTKIGQAKDIWHKGIVPTMATKPNAIVWIFSTPLGVNPENFFHFVCNEPDEEFVEHHAPSWINPIVDSGWIEKEKSRLPPEVFAQEIRAEWVDWTGVAFFSLDKMLVDGKPVAFPTNCDTVFAVMDSALKSGTEHDGTAVLYCARNKYASHPIVILDYDIISIDADLLTNWIPNVVIPRMYDLARQCGAREGARGIFLEDKASGIAINQHAKRHGWPVHPIESGLTALGKDERALGVSAHAHQGLCKISEYAFNKMVTYKGSTINHLVHQVTSFRLGSKDAYKRRDDLLDCFTYSLALALGTPKSYS